MPEVSNAANRAARYNKSIAEIADQFGLSTKTIRRYIAAGQITAYRVGPRTIRLNADEVSDQLLGRRVGGDAA